MDRSQADRIVREHGPALMELCGVPHWHIKFVLGPPDNPAWIADCERSISYNVATITLNHERYDDVDSLIDDIFHELCHVVLSPMDLHRDFAIDHIREDLRGTEAKTWNFCIEKACINLERIWGTGLRSLYLDRFTSGYYDK